MDIEDDDDNFAGFSLKKKGKTNKTLSSALQKKVQLITSEAKTNILLNGHLDPKNQSRRSFPELEHHNIGFESFLVKNKNKDQRSQVFDVLR